MGKVVVGGLLVASVVLGGAATWRYLGSERLVRVAAADLRVRGAALDGEACVAEVLDWGKRCDAMKVVCDEAVAPLVKTCLEARDRAGWCREIGPRLDTHFSFARCRASGYGKRYRPCAEAWLAVVAHCGALAPAGALAVQNGSGGVR